MYPTLTEFGWDDRVAARFTMVDVPAGAVPGRVVRVDRGSVLVATATSTVRASPFALASRRAGLDLEPVAGDWIALVDDPDEGHVVVAVVPRWSVLSREDPEEHVTVEQVLVANVDVVAVVSALDRPVSPNRIERMLAAVWESGAVPAVVLTKADVAVDVMGATASATEAASGADVLVTSALTGDGVDRVRDLAGPGRTLALVGPSGAGKSTLVNRLVGEDVQDTGPVREGDHRGRHTTTARELVPLGNGGVLLDTPGLRGFGLWDAGEGAAATFTDIEELATHCRFRDCGHDGEPGCEVAEALADGRLEERRFANYQQLQRELASLELRRDVHARRAVGRRFSRQIRQRQRFDPTWSRRERER